VPVFSSPFNGRLLTVNINAVSSESLSVADRWVPFKVSESPSFNVALWFPITGTSFTSVTFSVKATLASGVAAAVVSSTSTVTL